MSLCLGKGPLLETNIINNSEKMSFGVNLKINIL